MERGKLLDRKSCFKHCSPVGRCNFQLAHRSDTRQSVLNLINSWLFGISNTSGVRLLVVEIRSLVGSSTYPLVNEQFAIENGPVEKLSFPIKNGGSVHRYVCMFTRPGTTNLSQSIMIPVTFQDFIAIFFEFLRIWGPNPTVNSNDAIPPRLQKLLSVVAETRWPGVSRWSDLQLNWSGRTGCPIYQSPFFGQRKASWWCGLVWRIWNCRRWAMLILSILSI